MSSADRAAIAAEAVGFSYDGREVLHGIDLEAGTGELVGLLGPNGSGKSTLLRILSGVLAGYRGSVRLAGREVRQISRREIARRLAVVPQEPTFGFPFTALEVVLMGRHPHLSGLAFESPRDLELARTALARCRAENLAGRSIHELSSGERQRVLFAKALAQEPRILLLDEPASFLDIRNQVELYDIVRELASERGCCVVTALHDLNLAAEYCDTVYLLHEGGLAAGGPTAEVLTYANVKRVYETEVYVDTNALTGKVLVVPLSGRTQREIRRD